MEKILRNTDNLSTHKLKIAQMYLDGVSIQDIANEMGILPASVSSHVTQMGISNRRKKPIIKRQIEKHDFVTGSVPIGAKLAGRLFCKACKHFDKCRTSLSVGGPAYCELINSDEEKRREAEKHGNAI